MSVTFQTGYLETEYLSEYSYLSGQIGEALGCQIERRIKDDTDDLFIQVDAASSGIVNLGMELKRLGTRHRVCEPYLQEPYLDSGGYLDWCLAGVQYMQLERRIEDQTEELNVQVDQKIRNTFELNTQVERRITDSPNNIFTQVERKIVSDDTLFTQVERVIRNTFELNTQVERKITNVIEELGIQLLRVRALKLNTQVEKVLYNISQLRFLCEFSSRGTTDLGGNNWTSVQDIKPGSFSPNNLNTDIIEQRTETDDINALWQLRCNTGQTNTFVNTLAILNHNLSNGAVVSFLGSDDSNFSTVKFTHVVTVESTNMYWIADELPKIPAQYYEINIQDPANASDSLYVGTVLFGNSVILGPREGFDNPVTFGQKHFKNDIPTEGFTSKSNDRALRKYLSLNFSELKLEGGNFRLIREFTEFAKTDLKCLIIPRPTKPSALAVFAKLSQMPEESHRLVTFDDTEWRIALTLDWDESL